MTAASPLDDRLSSALASRAARGIQRRLTPFATPPSSTSSAVVDFSSNDYLSLASSPALKARYLAALSEPSASPYGPPSSRLLDGNSLEHQQLERELCEWWCGQGQSVDETCHPGPSQHLMSRFATSAPSRSSPLALLAGLLFNSGHSLNHSLFSTLPGPDDYVLFDELIHASVWDGMRASRVPASRRRAFKHSSPDALREALRTIQGEGETGTVFVALESLYSMDGDLCPLREMVEVVERTIGLCGDGKGGRGAIIVDEVSEADHALHERRGTDKHLLGGLTGPLDWTVRPCRPRPRLRTRARAQGAVQGAHLWQGRRVWRRSVCSPKKRQATGKLIYHSLGLVFSDPADDAADPVVPAQLRPAADLQHGHAAHARARRARGGQDGQRG